MLTASPLMPSWDVPALESTLPRHTKAGSMRYTDFEPIGSGGKAEVFRCRDIYLGRDVAFKVLHRSLAPRDLEQRMLMREARITAALSSRSIPAVFELGREREGRPFFTMAMIEGRSLHEILESARGGAPGERSTVEELIAIVSLVAGALGQAHKQGVIHGDVKPENIIVDDDGNASVVDWGLARIAEDARGFDDVESIGESWGRQGSALFMSPEQASNQPFLTHASDIYSLGVVLYECLTLRLPIHGEDAGDTLERVLSDEPAPPSKAAPDRRIATQLDELCMKALAKAPGDRFGSMAEFASSLTDALHDLLINFERDEALGFEYHDQRRPTGRAPMHEAPVAMC